MRKEQIISKGRYTHTQPSQLIGVKQYLFVRGEDGRKKLLLRLVNNRNEACSKFAFTLYRLDVKGNVLGEERFESTEREYAGKETFSLDRMIDVEEKCTDFAVKMIYANYGDYTYHVENNEVTVSYDEDRVGSRRGAGKEKQRKIHSRSFEMPWGFAIASLIILAIAFGVSGYLLRGFMDSETEFSLAGVHYEFADEERQTIEITGCSDKYKEVLLPSELDGYRVVGIRSGAFEDNDKLRKIKVEGIDLDAGCFKGCDSLESVELIGVTSIDRNAFSGCESLKTLLIREGEEKEPISISSGAFDGCKSLESVTVNQTIKYSGTGAIFSGCKSITELSIRNFAYTIEGVSDPLTYKKTLSSLFGGEKIKLKSLTVDYMDTIYEGFATGFEKLETVTIKESDIKTVGENAFKDCKDLKSLNIKSPLEEIGSYGFYNTSIESIDLSAVTTLGTHTLAGCKRLSSVKGLGESGFDSIPVSTFEGCSSLTAFELSETILTIGDNAFKGSGLTALEIPSTVVSIGNGVLKDCSKLERLSVYTLGEGGYLAFYFGADKKDNTDNYFAKFIPKSLKEVSLGEGKEITPFAFAGCTGVEKITLPEGIVKFGDYAFDGCTSLKALDIPSTTLTHIGEYALSDTAIEVVELPTTLEFIGFGALSGCNDVKSLTLPFLGESRTDGNGTIAHIFGADESSSDSKIPHSLATITLVPLAPMSALPAGAFKDCQGLTNVSIPSSITVIGDEAFANCKALTSFDLSSMEHIGQGAFKGCEKLMSAPLGQSLKTLGAYAFEGCGLTYLDVPSSVVTIGAGILKDCDSIMSIKLPYLGSEYTAIGNANIAYTFGHENTRGEVPESLTTVTISLELFENSLRTDAFFGCSSVSSFNLPSNLYRIESCAFENCAMLSELDLSKADYIGSYAFKNSGITKAILGENLLYIKESTFYGCTSLTQVELSPNLYSIAKNAFEGSGITEISLPDGLAIVGSYVFKDTQLKSLTLPSTVISMGGGVLNGCTELLEIEFPFTDDFTAVYYLFEQELPESLKKITVNDSSLDIIISGAFGLSSYVEEIHINAEVMYIEERAFYLCPELRYVFLPATVTWANDYAFEGCSRLYEINTLSGAFIRADNLIELTQERAPVVELDGYRYARYNGEWYMIDYPQGQSVQTHTDFSYEGQTVEEYHIPACLFQNDNEITELKLSSAVKSIGENAFNGCGSIKELVFENNERVTVIPDGMMMYNSSLERVVLPLSVKTIGASAFWECYELETVEMPTALEEIGEGAFFSCSRLNGIKLHSNVSYIGEQAFYGCTELYDVYSESSLDLVAGSEANGYVGRYAVKIQSDMEAEPSVEIEIDGIGTFRRSGGAWLLINGTDIENVVLGRFKYQDVTVSSYRVKEYAFQGRYGIKHLVIGDEVKQIQRGAFASCGSLISIDMSGNSSLKEIEADTFSGCGRLRNLTIADSVETIGFGAFYNCVYVTELKLPSALLSISDNAFTGLYRLVTVTLPAKLEHIGTDAFYGCYSLYEVYNLSDLEIDSSYVTNGGVGAYAYRVYKNTDESLDRYDKNGIKAIKAWDKWFLYDYTGDERDILVIDELDAPLTIASGAFIDTEFSGLVLPKCTSRLESAMFHGTSSIGNLYYKGDYLQWSSVEDYCSIAYRCNLYYYAECVHPDTINGWTYDSEGKVTTEMCPENSKITKEPTCFEYGERTYKCACEGCEYTRIEQEPILEHSFENDVCVSCKSKRTVVTDKNLGELAQKGTIEILSGLFEYDSEKGYFVSKNHHDFLTASMYISADHKMTVTVKYRVSSEQGADILAIYLNGETVVTDSGESSGVYSCILNEGDTLVISYEKDSSIRNGDDCVYIDSLEITD
ncbi:MAG: leucine-rich repeat domain-containing protein [Clostridia bacterium]|nr:leucine-rich repeat domain-containing protein [Clostridia bacterium]